MRTASPAGRVNIREQAQKSQSASPILRTHAIAAVAAARALTSAATLESEQLANGIVIRGRKLFTRSQGSEKVQHRSKKSLNVFQTKWKKLCMKAGLIPYSGQSTLQSAPTAARSYRDEAALKPASTLKTDVLAQHDAISGERYPKAAQKSVRIYTERQKALALLDGSITSDQCVSRSNSVSSTETTLGHFIDADNSRSPTRESAAGAGWRLSSNELAGNFPTTRAFAQIVVLTRALQISNSRAFQASLVS